MTKDDIILIKELIKESVRSVIREEIEATNRKDFKDVKLLLAKIIKENAAYKDSTIVESRHNSYRQMGERPAAEDNFKKRERLKSMFGKDNSDMINESMRFPIAPIPNISQEHATNISLNGTLPDIDAPIPFIDKNSIAWKAMQEKIS